MDGVARRLRVVGREARGKRENLPVAVGADWLVAASTWVSKRLPLAALISNKAAESVVMLGLVSHALYMVSMTREGGLA